MKTHGKFNSNNWRVSSFNTVAAQAQPVVWNYDASDTTHATLGDPRVQGGLMFAGGVVGMFGGAALMLVPDPTFLTKWGGIALLGLSADSAAAGLSQMWSNQSTQTLTSQGLQSVGVPPYYAGLVSGLTEIVLAGGAIGVIAKSGAAGKTGVKTLHGVPASAVGNVAVKGVPRITEGGLVRVESHLDNVLRNQFSDLPRPIALQFQAGERSMLNRLQSGMTSPRDIEFYMHELKESARFRVTGNLMDAHNAALKWRGVTSKDLFHPDVISKHPEIFGKGW